MDIYKYKELKSKNKISINKKNDEFFIKEKKFRQDTGEEISEIETHIKMNSLIERKNVILNKLEEVNQLIKDLKQL